MNISQVTGASRRRGLRHIPVIGVGGPVGSGKTALVEALCLPSARSREFGGGHQ